MPRRSRQGGQNGEILDGYEGIVAAWGLARPHESRAGHPVQVGRVAPDLRQRLIRAVVVGVVLIGLFVVFFVTPAHDPKPNGLPVAEDTPRGWRISKAKSRDHIDAVIAMAMCVEAA